MTIQEQITALLNGDMADEAHVAELMHVLAVSPEKRALLIEQVTMARAFATMGTGIIPPGSADNNILQGLASVDAAFGAPAPQAPPENTSDVAPIPLASFNMLAPVLGVLLVAIGIGAGYLFWGGNAPAAAPVSAPAAASATIVQRDDRSASLLAGARDSIAGLRSQLAAMSADRANDLRQIGELRNRSERVRVVYRDRPATQPPEPPATDRPATERAAAVHNVVPDASAPRTAINLAALRSASPEPATDPRSAISAARSLSSAALATGPEEEPRDEGVGRWQAGLRDNFRLSLPRVYGLSGNRTILFDKDVFATYRMGEDNGGLLSSFRMGFSFGETEFAQILHTNTGGTPIDTVIEQSPTLQYLRLLVAPELIRGKQMTGSIELGAGGALQRFRMMGPVATFGINLEYRPIDLVSIHVGASSWLLWTDFRNQTYVSTNLNAHLGFAVGF